MRKLLLRLAVLVAAVTPLLAGCAGDGGTAGEAATGDQAGGTAAPAVDTSRIVPLNGDVAEIVWALGLGDKVVGTDISATYPPEATRLPRIGYQRQLNAEGILSLRPTVVVGTDEAGPPDVIEQVRSAGTKVEIIPAAGGVNAVDDKIRAVAAALGVAEAGERLAGETATAIQAASAKAATATSKPRVAFLYVRGPGTLMIGGRGSRADAMITAAGGVDAGSEAGVNGFKPLTPEALADAKPDALLLLTAGLESIGGVEGVLDLPGVAQTPAGENRRVLHYDDLYLLGLGPRTGEAIDDLATGLHPELGTRS